jgi:membrane protease YdiL (CAAX protease family)
MMTAALARMVPERIGIALSVLLFAIPSLLLWGLTSFLIPFLEHRGWEPLVAWFFAGGLLFLLLLIAAILGAWFALPVRSLLGVFEHLRVRRLRRSDWKIAGLALLLTLVAMGAMQLINATVWPRLSPHPPFMTVEALRPGQYYILALWLPFFALNIIGEELWWRGFIQPRQEPVFGRATWIVQGLLHGAFHFSFGLGVMFVLWPAVFAIPWAVQRTRNTSTGILVHAGVNGPGFLAVTLGLLPA